MSSAEIQILNSSSVNVCVCAKKGLERLGVRGGKRGITALLILSLGFNYSGMDPFTEVKTFCQNSFCMF